MTFASFAWNSLRTFFTRLPSAKNPSEVPFNPLRVGAGSISRTGSGNRLLRMDARGCPGREFSAFDLPFDLDNMRSGLLDRSEVVRQHFEDEFKSIFTSSLCSVALAR